MLLGLVEENISYYDWLLMISMCLTSTGRFGLTTCVISYSFRCVPGAFFRLRNGR